MSYEQPSSALAERGKRGHKAKVEIELDPLQFYESERVGKEFTAFIPTGNQRRHTEARRDKLIVKNWRGMPTERGESTGDGLSAMRSYEAQRIIDSERMFLVVLATMTVLLGSIFTYFVMNFGF